MHASISLRRLGAPLLIATVIAGATLMVASGASAQDRPATGPETSFAPGCGNALSVVGNPGARLGRGYVNCSLGYLLRVCVQLKLDTDPSWGPGQSCRDHIPDHFGLPAYVSQPVSCVPGPGGNERRVRSIVSYNGVVADPGGGPYPACP